MINITGNDLTIKDVIAVSTKEKKVQLTKETLNKIRMSRQIIEDFIKEDKVIYGVTTGFGKFSDIKISKEDSKTLQRNLIVSHACGVGEYLSDDIVRAIMLLRINALAKGYSGVSEETISRLIYLLNEDILPLIPKKGSLGASGDLAPLSHMVLPIIGEGNCKYKGEIKEVKEVLSKLGLKPIDLKEKEGLALINGTQVMTAIGLIAYYRSKNIFDIAQIVSSITMEALNSIIDPFDLRVHKIRAHKGQNEVANRILNILKDSKLVTRQGELRVQDAYSIRCIPQVHGASFDALEYVKDKIEIEINSVTDNPIIFYEDKVSISGGNFHGQPMAIAFDLLSIAISEMANISERRIERLVNPSLSNLNPFLAMEPGLNSGFMIAQYTAASLVSENKVLSHPSSVDSIPSSANQEDHVSMGTIGSQKAYEIVKNVENVIAIELLVSCQAIDIINGYNKMASKTKWLYDLLRKRVSFMKEDRVISDDIFKSVEIIRNLYE